MSSPNYSCIGYTAVGGQAHYRRRFCRDVLAGRLCRLDRRHRRNKHPTGPRARCSVWLAAASSAQRALPNSRVCAPARRAGALRRRAPGRTGAGDGGRALSVRACGGGQCDLHGRVHGRLWVAAGRGRPRLLPRRRSLPAAATERLCRGRPGARSRSGGRARDCARGVAAARTAGGVPRPWHRPRLSVPRVARRRRRPTRASLGVRRGRLCSSLCGGVGAPLAHRRQIGRAARQGTRSSTRIKHTHTHTHTHTRTRHHQPQLAERRRRSTSSPASACAGSTTFCAATRPMRRRQTARRKPAERRLRTRWRLRCGRQRIRRPPSPAAALRASRARTRRVLRRWRC